MDAHAASASQHNLGYKKMPDVTQAVLRADLCGGRGSRRGGDQSGPESPPQKRAAESRQAQRSQVQREAVQ